MASSKPTKARTTTSSRKQPKPAASVEQSVQPQAHEPATFPADLQEQIRRRAYELFQQRNGNGGSPEQDWLRAESEILSRSA